MKVQLNTTLLCMILSIQNYKKFVVYDDCLNDREANRPIRLESYFYNIDDKIFLKAWIEKNATWFDLVTKAEITDEMMNTRPRDLINYTIEIQTWLF